MILFFCGLLRCPNIFNINFPLSTGCMIKDIRLIKSPQTSGWSIYGHEKSTNRKFNISILRNKFCHRLRQRTTFLLFKSFFEPVMWSYRKPVVIIIKGELYFTGFTGTQCEIDIDECKDKPCLNGGICQDLINSFKCTCASGFTGARCQVNIDDCVSQPCMNGGTCHDSIARYTCECPPGYTGNSCEININDCQSSPCQHGECIDGENSFTCQCHPG